MPTCSFCPGRTFVDDNAVRMHKDARHWWCEHCDRMFSTENSLDQHNSAKHPSFTCSNCDGGFRTREALQQHITDKHSMFECEYCDREFSTDEGRLAHEKAKHSSMFECEYCDRKFSTDEGRLAHEKAKHPTMFECEYCDREFSTEQGRLAHEKAVHPPTYGCSHCDREFASEEALTQHERAQHTNICPLCTKSFASQEALRSHEKSKMHFQCRDCNRKFHTPDGLDDHKRAYHTRPSTVTRHVPTTISYSSTPLSSLSLNEVKSVQTPPKTQVQDSAIPTTSEPDQDDIEEIPSATVSDSTSSADKDVSASDEGVFTPEEKDKNTVEESCACMICQRSVEVCACTICQRESPVLEDSSAGDHAGNIIPAVAVAQDESAVERHVRCPFCFNIVDAPGGLVDHACAPLQGIVPLHCTSCYAQFEDQSAFQEHLEGRRAFSCQVCMALCCSSDMLEDHLLGHPTCVRCGEFFPDDSSLCKHVVSEHPVIVCWDCDGIVVEQSSLELHYADSSAHPSCPFCKIGKRNSEDLDEHVHNDHAATPESAASPEVGDLNANMDREYATGEQNNQGGELGSEGNLLGVSTLPPPLSLPEDISLSIPSIPPQTQQHVEVLSSSLVANTQQPLELAPGRDEHPSPTPSEHGSNGSRFRMLTRTEGPENIVMSDDSRQQSPVSSVLADSFSDISSSTSSSQSVVFVSANGIPDYIRENRAYLVATSAGSPSSGRTPLRLPSTYSVDSLEPPELRREPRDTVDPVSNALRPSASPGTHRLHCRICLRDPCEDMTATICGHIFCKRCITQAVVSRSECPVCKSATLLYCLFKLDLSA